MPPIRRLYAQAMRNNPTNAERLLWQALRRRQIDGLIFRRQHGVGPFTVDFYCPALKLVIEADGGYHDTSFQQAQDRLRDSWLTCHNFHVLRFSNRQIFSDLPSVLAEIRSFAHHSRASFPAA